MSDADAPSYVFPEGVLARQVEGEMVLLNLNSEQYYALDHVGADIVRRLTTTSYDQVVADLCRAYDVDASTLRIDVEELLANLLEAGLLEQSQRR